jgi:uncharacterized membrane protein YhaH (DUF805 family)
MKQYFTTEGRLGRLQYFINTLIIRFASIMAGTLLFVPFVLTKDPSAIMLGAVLFGVFFIAGTVVCIMQAVRRLHDMEMSGSMYLLCLVPLANIYLAIILLFKKGTEGANQYGEDPVPYQELAAV